MKTPDDFFGARLPKPADNDCAKPGDPDTWRRLRKALQGADTSCTDHDTWWHVARKLGGG